jgi:acrylyl-CoA reductase (NADPH)
VRQWPMVAGIDGAGRCSNRRHPAWRPGDAFIHNGWGVGETHWGCLAEKARLKGDWLVRLPAAFTARQAMAIGTAGYTAMLCVLALERHGVSPARRGAGDRRHRRGGQRRRGPAGPAGLHRGGRHRQGGRGRLPEALGATAVIDRAELAAPGKPFQKERWAGVVDAVGSHTLANALAQTRYGGVVAACGLAQGVRPADHRDALHPARRDAGRHRFGDGAAGQRASAPGTAWPVTWTRPCWKPWSRRSPCPARSTRPTP